MEFLFAFLGAIGGASTVLGVLVYGPKKWIDSFFDRQLHRFQAELTRSNLEHQIRFTRLDAKLAMALEGAYELLCDYSIMSSKVVSHAYTEREEETATSYEQWESLANEFNSFLLKHSIYLPEEIALRLGNTRLALRDALSRRLDTWREYKDRKGEGSASSPLLKSWYESSDMQSECAELMSDLQKLVRAHLAQFPGDSDAS